MIKKINKKKNRGFTVDTKFNSKHKMVDYIIIFSEEQMLKSGPAKSIPVRLYLERVHTFTWLTVSAALETFPKCVKVN